MIEEHSNIVLTQNIPEHNLAKGDVGVVVHIHQEGEAYEVEFMTMDGTTIALITLGNSQVRLADSRMIPHVREIAV